MNHNQLSRYEYALSIIEDNIKDAIEPIGINIVDIDEAMGDLFDRFLVGFIDHIDEDGNREFEMSCWNSIEEIKQELLDAIIYSANIAFESGDLSDEQERNLKYVIQYTILALMAIKQIERMD